MFLGLFFDIILTHLKIWFLIGFSLNYVLYIISSKFWTIKLWFVCNIYTIYSDFFENQKKFKIFEKKFKKSVDKWFWIWYYMQALERARAKRVRNEPWKLNNDKRKTLEIFLSTTVQKSGLQKKSKEKTDTQVYRMSD